MKYFDEKKLYNITIDDTQFRNVRVLDCNDSTITFFFTCGNSNAQVYGKRTYLTSRLQYWNEAVQVVTRYVIGYDKQENRYALKKKMYEVDSIDYIKEMNPDCEFFDTEDEALDRMFFGIATGIYGSKYIAILNVSCAFVDGQPYGGTYRKAWETWWLQNSKIVSKTIVMNEIEKEAEKIRNELKNS